VVRPLPQAAGRSKARRGDAALKLGLLIPSFLPVVGGAELGALELARRLTARGHAVSVVTPALDPAWPRHESMDGVEVHRYPVPALGGRERMASIAAASLRHLGALWRRLAPNVINQHYLLPTGIAGQWWASRLRIPTVTTLIGMDVWDPHYRPSAPWRALMRRAIRKTQAVTYLSSFVRDVAEREYPPAPGVIRRVVPHGVDVKLFHPRARESSDAPVVLTVQRLYPRKGVATFLDAAALVARELPHARFVVVGDGPERAALERHAAALGLGARVAFTGRVTLSALTELYRTADVFAFHTLHEGLGIVLLEALASGCPVVTTAAGGTLDIVRDGDTGLVVQPADAPAFARAVLRVLREPGLAAALRARGRRRAETDFDWDVVTSRYLEVFESARAAPRG
jgi:glycosyltransferase involved in cell wall biosynthesis